MTEQIPQQDWDKLSPEAQSFLCLLASLRGGRVVEEIADKEGRVTAAVRSFLFTTEDGKVKGPKGQLTLTLVIGPETESDNPEMIRVEDKIACKYPEDRGHPVYVGPHHTLHTRQDTEEMLFAVRTEGDTPEIEYLPDRAAGPDS